MTTICEHKHCAPYGQMWRCYDCGIQWPASRVEEFKAYGWSDTAACELAAIEVELNERD